jgi:hypothetical protein
MHAAGFPLPHRWLAPSSDGSLLVPPPSPQARRARDGRHGRSDPHPPRPRGQRGGAGKGAGRTGGGGAALGVGGRAVREAWDALQKTVRGAWWGEGWGLHSRCTSIATAGTHARGDPTPPAACMGRRGCKSCPLSTRPTPTPPKVRADKLREVEAGHDGTWVAHPDLVQVGGGVGLWGRGPRVFAVNLLGRQAGVDGRGGLGGL